MPTTASNSRTIGDAFASLGRYVYMLVNPTSGVPFYVGKGTGTRAQSHQEAPSVRKALELLAETADVDAQGAERGPLTKDEAIAACDGGHPEIWIVRQGMTSVKEYTAVEAALIDVLMNFRVEDGSAEGRRPAPGLTGEQLTNRRREAAHRYGMRRLDDILEEFAAEPIDSTAAPCGVVDGKPLPLLSITLKGWQEQDGGLPRVGGPERRRAGYGYKTEWLRPADRDAHLDEIAMSAAGWWPISADTVKGYGIDYAVVEHHGLTRAVLRIDHDSWAWDRASGLRAFDYEVLRPGDELFDLLVGEHGRLMPRRAKGHRSPFRYWPQGIGPAQFDAAERKAVRE